MRLFGYGMIMGAAIAAGGIALIALNGYSVTNLGVWAGAIKVAWSGPHLLIEAAFSESQDSPLFLGILATLIGVAAVGLLLSGWAVNTMIRGFGGILPSGGSDRLRVRRDKRASSSVLSSAEGAEARSEREGIDLEMRGEADLMVPTMGRVATVARAAVVLLLVGFRQLAYLLRRLDLPARLVAGKEKIFSLLEGRESGGSSSEKIDLRRPRADQADLDLDAVSRLREWHASIVKGTADPVTKAAEAVRISAELGPVERALVIEADAYNGELMLVHVDAWARKAGVEDLAQRPGHSPEEMERIRHVVRGGLEPDPVQADRVRMAAMEVAASNTALPHADQGEMDEDDDGYLNFLNDLDMAQRDLAERESRSGKRAATEEGSRDNEVPEDDPVAELEDGLAGHEGTAEGAMEPLVGALSAFDDEDDETNSDGILSDEEDENPETESDLALHGERPGDDAVLTEIERRLLDLGRRGFEILGQAEEVLSGAMEWGEDLNSPEARREVMEECLSGIEAIIEERGIQAVIDAARENAGSVEWDWIAANAEGILSNREMFIDRVLAEAGAPYPPLDGVPDEDSARYGKAQSREAEDWSVEPSGGHAPDKADDLEAIFGSPIATAPKEQSGEDGGRGEDIQAVGRDEEKRESESGSFEDSIGSDKSFRSAETEGSPDGLAKETSISELAELEVAGDLVARWSMLARSSGASEAIVPKVLTLRDGDSFKVVGVVHAVFRWRDENSGETRRINLILRHLPGGRWQIAGKQDSDQGVTITRDDGCAVYVSGELLLHPEITSARTIIHLHGPGSSSLPLDKTKIDGAVLVSNLMSEHGFAAFAEAS